MHKQYLLRTGLVAALILGSLAGSVSASFSATTGPNAAGQGSRGSSNPGGPAGGASNGGGGNGGSGAGMPDALAVRGNCAPGIAVAACNPRPVPHPVRARTRTVDSQRCTNAWRIVQLEDGTYAEDRSEPMRKNCRVIRVFD